MSQLRGISGSSAAPDLYFSIECGHFVDYLGNEAPFEADCSPDGLKALACLEELGAYAAVGLALGLLPFALGDFIPCLLSNLS